MMPASQAALVAASGMFLRSLAQQWFHKDRSDWQVASSGGALTWMRLTQRRHLNLQSAAKEENFFFFPTTKKTYNYPTRLFFFKMEWVRVGLMISFAALLVVCVAVGLLFEFE